MCVEIEGWGYSPRGAGYLFGADVVQGVKYYYMCLFFKKKWLLIGCKKN